MPYFDSRLGELVKERPKWWDETPGPRLRYRVGKAICEAFAVFKPTIAEVEIVPPAEDRPSRTYHTTMFDSPTAGVDLKKWPGTWATVLLLYFHPDRYKFTRYKYEGPVGLYGYHREEGDEYEYNKYCGI